MPLPANLLTGAKHPVIEQGLMSPPTHYRLSGRQFYRSKDPTNSIKVLKEKRYKSKDNPEKANNTKHSKTINTHIYKKTQKIPQSEIILWGD